MAYGEPTPDGLRGFTVSFTNSATGQGTTLVTQGLLPFDTEEGQAQNLQALVDAIEAHPDLTLSGARKETIYVSDLTPTAPTEE